VQSLLPQLLRSMFESHFQINLPIDYLPRQIADRPPTIEEVWTEQVAPLMSFQQEVSERVFVLLNSDGGRAMIQMPTGSGKTRTVMDALARLLSGVGANKPVLWLAHSEELCEQAINTFRRSWILVGSGRVRIYRLWGDHMLAPEDVGRGLVVAGLQKLVSLRKKQSSLFRHLSDNCTALIFDEAHKALAASYTQLLSEFFRANPNLTTIGLSATPGRSTWNSFENKQLAKLFNNELISPNFGQKDPVAALRKLGVLARLKRVQLESPTNFALLEQEKRYLDDYFELPVSLLLRLSKNVNRNKLIISNLVEQVRQGNPTIVFACSVLKL
jgi:DNA repair protein RadD